MGMVLLQLYLIFSLAHFLPVILHKKIDGKYTYSTINKIDYK